MENQHITPFLWFNDNAEEAINFYTAVFDNAKIKSINRMPDGKVITMSFELEGQAFAALNGGPMFKFNPSVSFFVICETEAEVDATWYKLTEGGQVMMALDTYPWSGRYGWGSDRFGVSWQVMLGKREDYEQRIVPCLMFAGDLISKADEAVNFYTSLFKNAKIDSISRYPAEAPDTEGALQYAQFKLNGQTFSIMGSVMPHAFAFNEAVSFVINSETQDDIDHFWNKMTEGGGKESQCAWLKDKYGVSWQIVPPILMTLMGDKDAAKAQRVMQAMFQMKKIVIADLEKAYNQ